MVSPAHLSIRCAHCGDKVSMRPASEFVPLDVSAIGEGHFVSLHVCPNAKCIGAVAAWHLKKDNVMHVLWHAPKYDRHEVPDTVPERPREMLQQANDAKATPVPCVMAARSAVEAMLAEKKYTKGVLASRIDTAVEKGLLPAIMGDWAHEVRQFGNEPHTDDNPAPIATEEDAVHVLTYANKLADYLFVMPAEIRKARGDDSTSAPDV